MVKFAGHGEFRVVHLGPQIKLENGCLKPAQMMQVTGIQIVAIFERNVRSRIPLS
jgi:hypothetical protein